MIRESRVWITGARGDRPLQLGDLPKGQWSELSAAEIAALAD